MCIFQGLEMHRDCSYLFMSVKPVYAMVASPNSRIFPGLNQALFLPWLLQNFCFLDSKPSPCLSKIAVPGVLCCCLLDLYLNHINKCYLPE